MATPEDLGANADYIRMADQYVEVRSEVERWKHDTRGILEEKKQELITSLGPWWYQQQQLRQR